MQRRRAAIFTLILFIGLVGACGLWLRSEQHQYRLNRQLIAALVKNDTRAATSLVNEGADPNTRYTPTPVPSLLQLIKQILHRAPPPTNDSPTALLIACGEPWIFDMATVMDQLNRPDNVQLVQTMLTHHATINVKAHNGETPLMRAAFSQHLNTVRLLLDYKASVNTQEKDGNTALIFAVFVDNKAIIRQLLAHKADPNLADKDGMTPLRYAQGHSDIVALLRQAGAKK